MLKPKFLNRRQIRFDADNQNMNNNNKKTYDDNRRYYIQNNKKEAINLSIFQFSYYKTRKIRKTKRRRKKKHNKT